MNFELAKSFVENAMTQYLNQGNTRIGYLHGYINAMSDCTIINQDVTQKLLVYFRLADGFPSNEIVEAAIKAGWTITSDNHLTLNGDVSQGWCSEWSKHEYNGRTIFVPHFLERRMKELSENSK